MAPLSKESETAVSPGISAPPAKSSEVAKTQPVALEIPVTINGAHNVNGSGKREPFSESTNTVLLFAHGAVVRMNTPLAPGQLVFLTNEKTKKEIVCQAVKSKAGGSNTYVELKFTEPAPGFWGIRTQTTTDAPVAAIQPKVSNVPATVQKPEVPKEVKPADAVAPLAAAPPPAPVTPSPISIVPPTTAAADVPPTTGLPQLRSLTSALLEAAPASIPSLAGPSSVNGLSILPSEPEVVAGSLVPKTPSPEQASSPRAQESIEAKTPAATFKDFSKEIDALFGVPMSPSVRPPAPVPSVMEPKDTPSSTPSTQELKVQAAELQAKLGAMLFSETSGSALPPAEPPAEVTATSPDGLAAKLLEFTQEPRKPFVSAEPEATPAHSPVASKPVLPSLDVDDEVKIPAWLAPLSQSSESPVPVNQPVTSNATNSESSVADTSSTDDLPDSHGGAVRRSQASVFGGQLLGEDTPSAPNVGRSKVGLLLTLAAATILIVAVAAWYFLYGPGAPTNASTHPTHITSSVEQPKSTEPQIIAQEQQPESTPTVNKVQPAPTDSVMASPLPSKSSSVVPSPAVFNPSSERKVANPPAQQVAPIESPKKPALGNVHLAAPIVSRGASQTNSDAEPSIDISASKAGADVEAAFTRSNAPTAPRPVGGDVKPAQLIKSVPPEYPQIAKAQHVAGNVQIDALVDAYGKVAEVKAISGPQLLYRAALDAVKQWKYSPATLNGEPTSMHLTVMVQFRAQ